MKTMLIFRTVLIIAINLTAFCQLANCQTRQNTISDPDGNMYAAKVMPDGKQWLLKNLNISIEGSYCYRDSAKYCNEYGRLFTFQAAVKGCNLLGGGWRLPSGQDWDTLAAQFGGISETSKDGSKAAYKAMMTGGTAGFNIVLGGNRDGKSYARLNAHGFYWTTTENADKSVWYYNFGAGGKMLHRQEDGEKQSAFSVRCVRDVPK